MLVIVLGIVYSSSNVPQHHNSEIMQKQMCCINMALGWKVHHCASGRGTVQLYVGD